MDVWRATIELVAEALRDECAIGVEMSAATEFPLIELVDGAVDFWVFALGKHGCERTRDARAHTTKPLVGVGRFGGADRMADAVQSGQLDVIGPLDARSLIRVLPGLPGT